MHIRTITDPQMRRKALNGETFGVTSATQISQVANTNNNQTVVNLMIGVDGIQ